MIKAIAIGASVALLVVGAWRVSAAAPSVSALALATPGPTFPHLDVPGEQTLTGGNYIFYGPDGTQFHQYEQTNLILGTAPSPTPTPAPTTAPTLTPTATPTPVPTPTPAPVVNKFDDPAFTYFGTWGVYTGTEKYGGSDHFSADSTASYGFMFTGTAVTLYSQTADWMAIVAVSVDGGVPVEFDAYAATATQTVAFFRSGPLVSGVHRVIVHHTGRWNAAATEHQMTVDRADITNGVIIAPLAP